MASLLYEQKPKVVPIACLQPSLEKQGTSITGIVTLIWPYSSSKNSLSLLLAEPDFRLRRQKGQVLVHFSGSSATAVARCGISIGARIHLNLVGVKWDKDESTRNTPGKCVEWELRFGERVVLQILREAEEPIVLDIDHPVRSPTPGASPLTPPRSPAASTLYSNTREQLELGRGSQTWSSPAFLKRSRLSASRLNLGYDPFQDDDDLDGERRKRIRFGRGSGQWRFAEGATSPETTVSSDREIEVEGLSRPMDVRIAEEANGNAMESSTVLGTLPNGRNESLQRKLDHHVSTVHLNLDASKAAAPWNERPEYLEEEGSESPKDMLPRELGNGKHEASLVLEKPFVEEITRRQPSLSSEADNERNIVIEPISGVESIETTHVAISQCETSVVEEVFGQPPTSIAAGEYEDDPQSSRSVHQDQTVPMASASPLIVQADVNVPPKTPPVESIIDSPSDTTSVESVECFRSPGRPQTFGIHTLSEESDDGQSGDGSSDGSNLDWSDTYSASDDDLFPITLKRATDGYEGGQMLSTETFHVPFVESEQSLRPSADPEDSYEIPQFGLDGSVFSRSRNPSQTNHEVVGHVSSPSVKSENIEMNGNSFVGSGAFENPNSDPVEETSNPETSDMSVEIVQNDEGNVRQRADDRETLLKQAENQLLDEGQSLDEDDYSKEEVDLDEEMDSNEEEDSNEENDSSEGDDMNEEDEEDEEEEDEMNGDKEKRVSNGKIVGPDSVQDFGFMLFDGTPDAHIVGHQNGKETLLAQGGDKPLVQTPGATSRETNIELSQIANTISSRTEIIDLESDEEENRQEEEMERSVDAEGEGGGGGEEEEEEEEEEEKEEEEEEEEKEEEEQVEEQVEEAEAREDRLATSKSYADLVSASLDFEEIKAQFTEIKSTSPKDRESLVRRGLTPENSGTSLDGHAIVHIKAADVATKKQVQSDTEDEFPDLMDLFAAREQSRSSSHTANLTGLSFCDNLPRPPHTDTVAKPEGHTDVKKDDDAIDSDLKITDRSDLLTPNATQQSLLLSQTSSTSLKSLPEQENHGFPTPRLTQSLSVISLEPATPAPAHRPSLVEKLKEMGSLSSKRAGNRISQNVSSAASPWFTPMNDGKVIPNTDSDSVESEYETGQISTNDEEHEEEGSRREPRSTEILRQPPRPHGETVSATSPTHTSRKTAQPGFRTTLSYFAPLAALSSHFSLLTDTLAIAISSSALTRATAGPRDYHQSFSITDPSSASSSHSPITTARIFRPNKTAFPTIVQGDAILLRNFKVQTERKQLMLLSTDSSAWAVFRRGDEADEAQMNGPPVEFGAEERGFARGLWDWWASISEETRQRLERAVLKERPSKTGVKAKETDEKTGRGSQQGTPRKSRLVRHELRDGTSYTDGPLPDGKYEVHELRDGTKYKDKEA